MATKGLDLHRSSVVLDCHNDLIMTCASPETLGDSSTFQRRWIPELRAGGVKVQVVPIASESANSEASLRMALQHMAAFYREVERNPAEVEHCRDGTQINRAVEQGKIAMVLALEGASCLGSEAALLRLFYELGVRMISFTHMGRSWLADGSGENATGGRLTRAGVAVLSEMERLGILMDVSHLGIASTEHVLELATRPVVASHSSARALREHHRNLTDTQIRAIAVLGGVIGVNMLPAFIDPERNTLGRVVDHIEHMVDVAGIDHVGIGSDFIVEIYDDFYPADIPLVIEGIDARQAIPDFYATRHLPRLTEALLQRGLSDGQVRAVLGLNFMRVFEQVMGIGRELNGGTREAAAK